MIKVGLFTGPQRDAAMIKKSFFPACVFVFFFGQNGFAFSASEPASPCPRLEGHFQWITQSNRNLTWSITQADCDWFEIEAIENMTSKQKVRFDLSGQKWLVRQNSQEQLWAKKIRQSRNVIVFRFEFINLQDQSIREIFDRRLVLQVLDSETALLRDQYGELMADERFVKKAENLFIRQLQ
jgi:hypothetical protein